MTTILFVVAIFFGIWFTTVNIMRFAQKQSVPNRNFIIMSASLTAIITHLIGIW